MKLADTPTPWRQRRAQASMLPWSRPGPKSGTLQYDDCWKGVPPTASRFHWPFQVVGDWMTGLERREREGDRTREGNRGRGHLGVRPKKISWVILIYLEIFRGIPNWGYLKDIVHGYKRISFWIWMDFLFGYERISMTYPFISSLYPLLFIFSYPIISNDSNHIHRYP